MNKEQMIINNLRHRKATVQEVEAEIEFRKQNGTLENEKCFGYTTEELEVALKWWNDYFHIKITF